MKLGLKNEGAVRAVTGGGFIADELQNMDAVISTGFNKEHDPETNRHATILSLGPVSERGRTTAMGDWINIPFGSVAFTASGTMAWTVTSGSMNRYRYMLIGHTLFLGFTLTLTSVTAPLSTILMMPFPAGFTSHASTQESPFFYTDNGNAGIGVAQVLTGSSVVRLFNATLGNWSASVSNSTLAGQLAIEIQ